MKSVDDIIKGPAEEIKKLLVDGFKRLNPLPTIEFGILDEKCKKENGIQGMALPRPGMKIYESNSGGNGTAMRVAPIGLFYCIYS